MLVGGHFYSPVDNMNKVEVLDLEGSGSHCQLSSEDRIPDYPMEVRFTVGTYLPELDMPVICGGEFDVPSSSDTETTNLCYAYDKQVCTC